MITREVEFRQGIFTLLYQLKGKMGATKFKQLISLLDTKMSVIPINDIRQSKVFFREVTTFLLNKLEQFYTIEHEAIEDESFHVDSYTLIPVDEIKAFSIQMERFNVDAKFRDCFLHQHNHTLWNNLRRSSYRYNRLRDRAARMEDGSFKLNVNDINPNDELAIPRGQYGRSLQFDGYYYFSNIYDEIEREKTFIDVLKNQGEALNLAFQMYERKIQEILKKELRDFENQQLIEYLSRMVIPVHLLEDSALKEACVTDERELLFIEPPVNQVLSIGISLHIYSSEDVDDDSSYQAFPVVHKDEAAPERTGLIYHGIGQYTGFDPESPRSLDGAIPYVVNNNLYVKINPNDFISFLPKKIRDEIRICKSLLDELEIPFESILLARTPDFVERLNEIKSEYTNSSRKIIESFFALGEHSVQTEQLEFNLEENPWFDDERFDFSLGLLSYHPNQTHGYVVFKDDDEDLFVSIYIMEDGQKRMSLSSSANEAFNKLGIHQGVYSIYSFKNRYLSKPLALKSIHVQQLN